MNAPNSPFPTQDAIARRARQLWDERGRPANQDTEIWHEAERQLRAEVAPPATVVSAKPARARRRPVAADEIKPEEVTERLNDFGETSRRSATSVDLT